MAAHLAGSPREREVFQRLNVERDGDAAELERAEVLLMGVGHAPSSCGPRLRVTLRDRTAPTADHAPGQEQVTAMEHRAQANSQTSQAPVSQSCRS